MVRISTVILLALPLIFLIFLIISFGYFVYLRNGKQSEDPLTNGETANVIIILLLFLILIVLVFFDIGWFIVTKSSDTYKYVKRRRMNL